MKITVTTTDDKIFFLDVAEDLELENLKALCAMEIGSEVSQIMVVFNGRELTNDKNSLQQFGVRDGDCIVLERRRSNPNRRGEFHSLPINVRFMRCARRRPDDHKISGSLNALLFAAVHHQPRHELPASGCTVFACMCACVCEFILEKKRIFNYINK